MSPIPRLPPVTSADFPEMSNRPVIGGILRVIQALGARRTYGRRPIGREVASDSPGRRGSQMEVTEGTAWEHDVKARLVARDPGALAEMYDQFGSFVFGLASRVIRDRRAAEDVTQDVFLSLWERPEATRR